MHLSSNYLLFLLIRISPHFYLVFLICKFKTNLLQMTSSQGRGKLNYALSDQMAINHFDCPFFLIIAEECI